VVRRRKRKVSLLAILAVSAAVAAGAMFVLHRRPTERPALLLPPGCKLGQTVAGIDVSYYQGAIAWPRVRRAGVRFAFVRAYDGLFTFDASFVANWKGAGTAGVLRGAYQYFRPAASAIEQADALVRVLRTYGAGELPPVLDVETLDGLALADVAAAAKVWVDRVRTQLGIEPIVYTSFSMWQARPAAELGTQPLWLAHYTTECPSIPRPWLRWVFWQYTDSGRVPGISTPVDLDVFDGSLDDLRRRFAR
jgi:lysozyme